LRAISKNKLTGALFRLTEVMFRLTRVQTFTAISLDNPRVCTGSGRPGKFWNFLWHFPGLESAGKGLLVLESF